MPSGKTYVISDIHGHYQAYLQILDAIQLKVHDRLYIVGDVLDRGPAPITLLQDIMKRPNVELLLGNHELFALLVLDVLVTGNTQEIPLSKQALLQGWSIRGAMPTITEFQNITKEKQQEILSYLQRCAYTKSLQIGQRRYLLAHTDMPVIHNPQQADYHVNLSNALRIYRDEPLVPDGILISGHTPTHRIDWRHQGQIIQGNHTIFLDCGPSRLGCLCLDDLSETYVPVKMDESWWF
ncbi:fructose-bisphosphatase class III [Bengtsoniella intestinalis]|uniref:fructose-bisphosphatase class III n=1 Tax=Bengtsoniella intestinalis TaxID=3073143 RepID=UPI00391FC74F